MRLQGQVALITGSGRGIGRAIAERFAREGAAVFLTSNTETELQTTGDAISAAGGHAAHLAGDIAAEAFIPRLLEHVRRAFGPVDVLINNAGLYEGVKAVVELSPREWDRVLEVNLRAPFLLLHAVLPEMIERRRGVVLNISSISAKAAFPWGSAYAASKAGLIGLTRVAAAEVAAQGVRVNALCPGAVSTRMWEELGRELTVRMGISRDKLEEMVLATSLQGRRPTPDEVAAAALFLCSDDASAITGQAVNVDGGAVYY